MTPKPTFTLVGLALLLVLSVSCSTAAPEATLTPTLSAGQSQDATAGANGRATRQAALAATATQAVLQETQIAQTADAASTTDAVASATARAQQAATATVVAQATGKAVVAAKFGWASLIKDSFTDNQLGWPTGPKKDNSLSVTSTLADGTYQWTSTVSSGNSYFNLIPTNGPVLTNFYALVTVKFDQGNDDGGSAYGLTFNQVGEDYGFFGILKSGGYRALEVHHTGIYQTRQGTSPAIQIGQPNRIAVVGIGSDYVFLVNNQVVSQLHADFTPGQLGLGIDAALKAKTAQVEFSDFEVRTP